MANKETLPDDLRDTVCLQIGDLLPGLYLKQSPAPKAVQLRESFTVWALDLSAPAESVASNLSFPAREAHYWHHQILFDGKAEAYAESVLLDSGSLRVAEVSISPLAQKIDAAIDWVERQVDDSVLVRFLALPAFLLYTFWLVDRQQIYIIDAFPELVHLKPGQLLHEDEFLAVLRADIRVVALKRQKDGRRR